MLLVALKEMPGSVQIIPGQKFVEPNPELAERWIRTGLARREDAPNSRGWNRLYWDGATVVIIASGESLTLEQCERVKYWRQSAEDVRRVIVINTSFRRAPWADLLYACDGQYWEAKDKATGLTHFQEAAQCFTLNNMWTQDEKTAQKLGIQFVRSARSPGLSKQVGVLNQGANSGFQAMNLAYWAGATRMILLGFDCKGKHWHADHPAPLKADSPFKLWIDHFRTLSADLQRAGVEVFNCSPGTAIPHFTKADLASVL